MSRTYRLRHLPRMRGVQKYVDASRHQITNSQRNEIYKILDAEFGKNYNFRGEYWHRFEQLCSEMQTTVQAMWSHPWVSWGMIGSAKTYYKRNGNRWARRRERIIVSKNIIDDDFEGHFVHRRERFDKWDVY